MIAIRSLTVCALAALLVSHAAVAETKATDEALAAVVAGEWRSPADRARDAQRHPAASLSFWGLRPGMTILEIQPGGGWWTDILAPYAHRTGGKYYATAADLDDPKLSDGARTARERFAARLAAKPEIYGQVELVNWGPRSAPLPAETFDFVLTARNVHGWMRSPGMTEKAFREIARSLKPGGILALEQHRADPGPQDPQGGSGYVTEAFVIEQAEKAGLQLIGKSEINANPKDTKDHPFGVWTLPPTRTTVPYGSGQPPDPSFDRAKYDAIGESDRMTLKFRKPG